MSILRFTVYGEPVAEGRPRFKRIGKFVTTYLPKKTKNELKRISDTIKAEYKGAPKTNPLAIHLGFYFGIPKSYTKKKIKELSDNQMYYTKKPDCDNLAKLVMDAMNGIVYEDDSQIYSLQIVKKYTHPETDDPRVEITIGELNNDTGTSNN